MFTEGKVYQRREDLHKKYGGNIQSGISPCSKYPVVFLFTSQDGEKHGYKDRWLSDSMFEFTGEGQLGDMELLRGNRAIKQHKDVGRELHLFQKEAKGEYKYLGEFEYVDHEIRSGEDTDKIKRKMLVFRLQKV